MQFTGSSVQGVLLEIEFHTLDFLAGGAVSSSLCLMMRSRRTSGVTAVRCSTSCSIHPNDNVSFVRQGEIPQS